MLLCGISRKQSTFTCHKKERAVNTLEMYTAACTYTAQICGSGLTVDAKAQTVSVCAQQCEFVSSAAICDGFLKKAMLTNDTF